MRKYIGIIVFIFVFLLTGCNKEKSLEDFNQKILDSDTQLEEITDEYYFVYFYQTDCETCSNNESQVVDFIESNINVPIYILNTENISTTLSDVVLDDGPTMAVYYQGELIELYPGVDYLNFFLERYGVIDYTDYKDFVGHNEFSFDELEFKNHDRYIAYYYSDECGHCASVKAELLAFFKDFDGMPFYFIDVAEAQGNTNVQGLTGTPTLLIFNEGGILDAYVGSDQVREFIEEYQEIDYDDFLNQHLYSYQEALEIEKDAYIIYYYLEGCPHCMAAKDEVLNWALKRGVSDVYFMNGAEISDPDNIPTELLVLQSGTPILVVMTNGKFADEYYSGTQDVLEYIEELGTDEITTDKYMP